MARTIVSILCSAPFVALPWLWLAPADAGEAGRPAGPAAEKPADKPAEKPAEKPAGGAPEKPAEKPADKPAEKLKPLPLQPQMKPFLTASAARCGTIVLVKVAAAGEAKPDEEPPAQDQADNMAMARAGMWWGGQFKNIQRARCEVTEVIRGDAGLKECTVLCRYFNLNGAQQMLWQEAQEAARKKKENANFNITQDDMLKRAALAAGETYLLVLMPDEIAKPAAGEKPPLLATGFVPVQAPSGELLGEMRKLVKRIQEYQNPPALTAEQRTAANKLLADLGAPGYETRAKASEALLAFGTAVQKLLEETARTTADLEVRERCALILDDLKPIPGGKPEDWAGTAAVRKSEEKPAPASDAVAE